MQFLADFAIYILILFSFYSISDLDWFLNKQKSSSLHSLTAFCSCIMALFLTKYKCTGNINIFHHNVQLGRGNLTLHLFLYKILRDEAISFSWISIFYSNYYLINCRQIFQNLWLSEIDLPIWKTNNFQCQTEWKIFFLSFFFSYSLSNIILMFIFWFQMCNGLRIPGKQGFILKKLQ